MYNKGWYKVEKDDSVKKIILILEPLISDLEEQKKKLSERREELERVSRFIAYTKDNLETVGVYAEQDLIIDSLGFLNIDKDDYKACCYLLKGENENIKKLPQYMRAYNLVSDIIEYFKLHKAELIVEIQELDNLCAKKELEKKYYDILSSPTPLVEDNKEFVEFLKEHGLLDEEIVSVLYSTISNNVINYGLKNN